MRKQALWDESNRASNVRTLVFIKQCKERLSDNRKIHTQVKNWRNMYENEQPLTEKHWTASKMEKKYKPKSGKWQNLLRTSTALKVKRQMLSDVCSSLFPCGAHSARNGQGQTSELRVPGCAACSGMWVFICGCFSCTFGLGLWQVLDADGWCLMTVLYMVLSDILAERRMARRTQVRWKGCFTFTGASLADSGLRQVGLFLWWLCVLSFLSFFGKERGNSRRWRRRGERQHAYEQTQKKCHRRWQQPATHARKLDFTSTKQQTSMSDNRNIKNQVQKYWWIL